MITSRVGVEVRKRGGVRFTTRSWVHVTIGLLFIIIIFTQIVQNGLGCHPLSEATLQTVVDRCVNFDKDPFLGPVGKDG